MVLVDKLDELGKPAWIALIVLGFMAWWPVGLLVLAFFLGSGRMGCSYRHNGGLARPLAIEDGADAGENGPHALQDGRRRVAAGGAPPSSGNRAFDDYRTETLKRLEDEQREFKEFLERLRFAKDRSEFDQFMAERRNRPQGEVPQPPPQPQA